MLCKCIHVIVSDPDFHLQKKSKVLNPRQALMTDTNFKNEKKGKDRLNFICNVNYSITQIWWRFQDGAQLSICCFFCQKHETKALFWHLEAQTTQSRLLHFGWFSFKFCTYLVFRYLKLWICKIVWNLFLNPNLMTNFFVVYFGMKKLM